MKQTALFFTLYWIIYFPTCIAYNDLPGFSSVDELLTVVLIGYTMMQRKRQWTIKEPLREYYYFLGILAAFVVYGVFCGANTSRAVFLDLVQVIRPYSIIYCTWILNPQFTKKQMQWMLISTVGTLLSWIFYHPESRAVLESGVRAEFPVLGQLSICAGMSWYLFTKQSRKNRTIAVVLVMLGMLAPKFKFMGEVVCFIALTYSVQKHFRFDQTRTWVMAIALMAVVLTVTWQRVDVYYVSGFSRVDDRLARPETYKTALRILVDYFPFGSGMGSFACNAAWKIYSPLYYKYGLNTIWGLDPGGGFIADAFYPTLAQFGVVGVYLFYVFWKRRLQAINVIEDMRYYRMAWMAFFCLAIEQTADSSFLSGKGMGYCMILGLCLNANRNAKAQEEELVDMNILTPTQRWFRGDKTS